MARAHPVVRSGGWYHVMNRGVGGTALFPTPHEAAAFVSALGEVAERFPVEVHAYCAMGNHYHLLVRGEEAEVHRALAKLEDGLAGRSARARVLRMALGRHFLQVTRYIHRNPVEAGLVRRPEDWPWSSYRGYLDRIDAPPWLRSDVVLGWLGSIGARQRYRKYVEDDAPPFRTLRDSGGRDRLRYGSIMEPIGGPLPMASLTLKGVPDDLLDRLRHAAEANRRSLNREVIDRLARSLESRPIDARESLARADALRARLGVRSLTDEAIRLAKRSGRP